MTNEKSKKIFKKAKNIPLRYGFTEQESEDLAQDVLCKMLEGRHRNASVRNAIIDAIRARFGDSRKSRNRIRANERYAYSYEAARDDGHDFGSRRAHQSDRVDLERFYTVAKGRSRDIIGMLDEGWGPSEIARYLKISPSRVSQIIEKIQVDLEALEEQSELLPIIKNDEARRFCCNLIKGSIYAR